MRSTHQAGVAIHVVNHVSDVVVTGRSFQSDASTDVVAHLRYSPKYVFYSRSHAAYGFVDFDFCFTQRVVASCFAHQKFLSIDAVQ